MTKFLLKKAVLGVAFLGWLVVTASGAWANDLPTAAGSPIAGIAFDDRPLILPVQRNFQMAMLTVSSELGRSCGRMEAYGWRLESQEQARVNQIFNNTVDRMRAQGYGVETKNSSAVSSDVTLFTADRTDRHLIFLWSAGEIGLVMVLCETSAPLPAIPHTAASHAQQASQPANFPSHLPMAETIRSAKEPEKYSYAGRKLHESFSPIGKWIGDYTCAQGTTGATFQLDKLKGDHFEGAFSFYPTAKNPYVPEGKYLVFGEYDADSQRILINPGKWVKRPKDFYNTIMIGSFDPVNGTFSAYFQGITGCTSFEASLDPQSVPRKEVVSEKKSKAKAKKTVSKKSSKKKSSAKKTSSKKTAVKKSATKTSSTQPAADSEAKPNDSSEQEPVGIEVGDPVPLN
ncbi:MAG: hypothetical protein AB7E52_06760 [Bdellovibrionales bacterium]